MNMNIMKLVKDNRVFPTFEVTMKVAMRFYTLSRAEKDNNKAFEYLVRAIDVCDVAFEMVQKVFAFENITLNEWITFVKEYLFNEYENS